MTETIQNQIKLSIVTINYNNINGLKRTVQSVINQTIKDFEYIVIDGGSTDGSAEYILEMQNIFAYWVSEKDTGVYNAMNKAMKSARGEYLLYLNSGDCLLNANVIENVLYEIESVNMESGKQCIFLGSTKQLGNENWFNPPKSVTLYHLYKSALPHQGLFLPKSLAEKFPFNEGYKIVSDWIQSVEILLSGLGDYRILKKQALIAINEEFGLCATPDMQFEKDRYIAENSSIFRRLEDYGTLRNKYDQLKNVVSANLLNRVLWKIMLINAGNYKE